MSLKTSDFLLAVFTLYLAFIIAIELVLGSLRVLTTVNLVIVSAVLYLTVISLLHSAARGNLARNDNISGVFSAILGDKVLLFAAIALTVFSLNKLLINLMNPPFGWDSLNYHFTFAAEWLKGRALETPITINDDPSPSYYPINGSLYYAWLLFPLGDVFLADLGQFPFFLAGLIATYALAGKLGLSTALSLYAAFLFGLIPNVLKQLSIAYVDLMVAAYFLIGLNFLILFARERRSPLALFFGVSCGLLIGTKTTGLPFAAILIIPFILLAARRGAYLKYGLIGLSAILALGFFTYWRNFWETGNPCYPLGVSISGKEIFHGVMSLKTYKAHFRPDDYRISKWLFSEGLGLQISSFGILGMLGALGTYLFREKRRDFFQIYILSIPLLLYLLFRYVIPLPNIRYLYASMALSIVLGFYVCRLWGVAYWAIRVLAFVCVASSMGQLAKRQELVAGLVMSFAFWGGSLLRLGSLKARFFGLRPQNDAGGLRPQNDEGGLRPQNDRRIPRLANRNFITGLIIVAALMIAHAYYRKNEFRLYPKMVKYSGFWPDAARAWAWLDSATSGNNIAYVGRPVGFPLYGSQLKNNVYYVSVNTVDPAKLHYFLKSNYAWGLDFESQHADFEQPDNYRGQANYAAWLSNIRRRNTDYLFVYSLHQTKEVIFPLEDVWAGSHPEQFRLVYSNSTIRIYQVKR